MRSRTGAFFKAPPKTGKNKIAYMNFKTLIGIAAAIVMAAACSTPAKIAYFQDAGSYSEGIDLEVSTIRLQPEDKISIIVNCQDVRITNQFNLPYVTQRIGQTSETGTTLPQGVSGYTIDKDGNIDFPVIGTVHIGGMTREEVAAKIKNELVSQNLVKDPIVTVEFMNLTISVLGEVTRPGKYSLEKDKVTILDAIAMAGDLTIFGQRENVKVLRMDGGKQMTYFIDLTSADSVMNSPAYFLRQNDMIYVEPNEMRMRQSTVNGNNIRSSSFWISLATLAATVTSIVIRLK